MAFLSTTPYASCLDWIKALKEFQLDSLFDTQVLGRAYLYMKEVNIQDKEKHSIIALVGEKRYEVHIYQDGKCIYGRCSCPYEGNCKHLAAMLLSMMDIEI